MNRLFVEVHDAELQNELINDPKRPRIPFSLPKGSVTMYNLPKDVQTSENAKNEMM